MDFTEIVVDKKKYYICGIISIHTKVLVGYAKSSKNNTKIALEALNNAIELFGVPYMLLTDRGSPFISKDFHVFIEEKNILHSMSRPYTPTDNIFIETFWKTCKIEMGNISSFREEDVEKIIAYYFYYYNYLRPHSSIGYKTPIQEWIERH